MSRRRILIAPLNWGLGHASRCVPLINKFRHEGHEVLLSANGRAGKFLQQEFPDLQFIPSPDYSIRYSRIFPLWLMMFFQSPAILYSIFREHKWLDKAISKYKIDEVISDNRYGLWSNKIRCVFITHQLMIKCPKFLFFLEPVIHRTIKWFIGNYTECWVPDVEGEGNLSGDLSHKYPLGSNTKFIGFLSRFERKDRIERPSEPPTSKILQAKFFMCFILSGPEPQRTALEKKIIELADYFSYEVLLIQGKPEENKEEYFGEHLHVVSAIKAKDLEHIIYKTPIIFCRAGYSSLMDLKTLGKTGFLVPTPGQTEQEYLAYYLTDRAGYTVINQRNFVNDFKNHFKK